MDFFTAFNQMLDKAGFKDTNTRATALGCSDEYVRKISQGKQVPSDKIIHKALERCRVSEEECYKILMLAAQERAKGPAKDTWGHLIGKQSEVREPAAPYIVTPSENLGVDGVALGIRHLRPHLRHPDRHYPHLRLDRLRRATAPDAPARSTKANTPSLSRGIVSRFGYSVT